MFSSALRSFVSNIISNYTIETNHSFVSGPWKVYNAKKKSNGKSASVFIFDRKTLEPNAGSFAGRNALVSLKRAHEEVIERLKKEASSLAKLRHPNILELAEPVEETRNGGLMFATEPVTASLGSVLRSQDDDEKRGGSGQGDYSDKVNQDAGGGSRKSKSYEIDELEIQKGLLQIARGLEFLHESAGLTHGNFCPEAIFINGKSDWKISGLAFASPPEGSNIPTSVKPISLFEILNFDARLPRSVQLSLDYSSPDFVIESKVTAKADMFSLGLLIVAIYSSPHRSPINVSHSVTAYKKLLNVPSNFPTKSNNFLSSKQLPKQILSDVLPRLLMRNTDQRISAKELQHSSYFDNILVSAIKFLESFPTKSKNEKNQFLRGLPRILDQFPTKVLEKKILPGLMEEVKDREILSLILQNTLKICQHLPPSSTAFAEVVLPKLRVVFLTNNTAKAQSVRNDTSNDAGIVMILENLAEVSKKCSRKQFKDDILPIVYLGLESNTNGIVDLALRRLPIILVQLDYATITNELFPLIATIFKKTSSMGIKIRGLEALRVFCGNNPDNIVHVPDKSNGLDMSQSSAHRNSSSILDKYTVQENVTPLLKAIKTKEPTVIMAALPVFRQIGTIADAEFVAIEVLPVVWAFALGPLLDLNQFKYYMALIKELSTKIEQEQIRKLRDISADSRGDESSDLNEIISLPHDFSLNFPGESGNGMDDDFANLVLGRSSSEMNSVNKGDKSTGYTNSFLSPSSRQTSSKTNFSEPANDTNSLRAQNVTQLGPSRSITPDYGMNKFAPLKPSNSIPSANVQPPIMQPLQPWTSNGGLDNNIHPNQPGSTSTKQSTDYSSFKMNVTNSSTDMQQMRNNSIFPSSGNSNSNEAYNAFASNPGNSVGSLSVYPNASSTTQSDLSYAPFNIPPPATGSKTSSGNIRSNLHGLGPKQTAYPDKSNKMQKPQKQGLEKFESLL